MANYDDGNRTIPGGVEGPVQRVVIVGAGMAGLAAANALGHAGVECVVLEARDRIGGRLHTIDLGGSPVDLGGSWIHTPIGNPMSAWSAQNGVAQRPAEWWDASSGWDPASGPVDHVTYQRLHERLLTEFMAWLADAQVAADPSKSASAGIDRYVAGLGLSSPDERHIRAMLRGMGESDASGSLEERSFAWSFRYGIEYEGDSVGDMPVGGYRRLLEPLADGVDVRLGAVARRVEVGAAGISVETEDGETHLGSHVLVTVPVGVLKAGSIAFEPGLPASHLDAIQRLGFGQFEKIAIRFADAAWLPDGLPNTNVLASPADPELPIIVSLDRFVGEPVVVAFGFGSTARLIADGTEAEAVARLLDLVARITGVQPPEPVVATRTDWGQDPHTLGAYSYVAIGGTPDDFDALGEPVAGRLLFAGEATSQLRTGYADGAMTSGIREGKRLLGVTEVQLGRLTAAVRRD